jgi:hypothetical protein
VTTTLETLLGLPGADASELDFGVPISGRSVRKMVLEGAELTPVTVDGNPPAGAWPGGSATIPETPIGVPPTAVERYSTSSLLAAASSAAGPVSARDQIRSPCSPSGRGSGGE